MPFGQVNQAVISAYPKLLFRWFPDRRPRGREFEVASLASQSGHSLRINFRTGIWKGFVEVGVGSSDPISLFAAREGLSQLTAACTIADQIPFALPDFSSPSGERRQTTWCDWQPLLPPQKELLKHGREHPKLRRPDHVYTCHDAQARAVFFVCRWVARGERKKAVMPFSYGELQGAQSWHWKHPNETRPFYRVPELLERLDPPFLAVQGEKAADTAVMWPGRLSRFGDAAHGLRGVGDAKLWHPQ